jgi:hypothetical protein
MTDSQTPSILAFGSDGNMRQRFFLVEPLLLHPTALASKGDDLWVVDEGRKSVLHFRLQRVSTGLEHALLGEEYLATNHAREAADQFKSASALGMLEDALKDYQDLIALAPTNTAGHYGLGTTYLTLGRLEAA